MTGPITRRVSLEQIKDMRKRNELFHDTDAPAGDDLGAAFWEKAEVQSRPRPRSVHLKLDPDVFEFFYEESHGKGHLTKMQNVLRSYVAAKRRA